MKKLTAKQAKFVSEYIKDFNGKQAAIRAKYSKKTASEQAARLLTNVNVSQAIQKAQEKIAEKDMIDAEFIKKEALSLYRKCSGLDTIKKTTIVDGAPIELNVKEFNGPAANKALETLGKHVDIQAFKEQIQLEGQIDMVSPLIAARKRLEKR